MYICAHAGDAGTHPRNESTRATGRTPSALARRAALSRFVRAGQLRPRGLRLLPKTAVDREARKCGIISRKIFFPPARPIETLLEKNLIELEHTSGTSSERLPVIFARGWWNAQEERALRLNDFVAKILDEFPNARRATITSPACNGLTCPTVWMSREQRTFGNALFVNLARIPFLVERGGFAAHGGGDFRLVAAISRR